MRYNEEWKDFEVISTSNGEKLERWGNYFLLRPDPQVIWGGSTALKFYPNIDAHYIRSSSGGGYWDIKRTIPDEWNITWRNLVFSVKLMGFKHTGVFPEQAYNWSRMIDLIKSAQKPVKVLNLFAYTGGATLACVSAGAEVTHVDASKGMTQRAKENLKLSNLPENARWIVDDCEKYILREINRGNKYDAIIMDPPSYGRGPNGEVWKIEEKLFDFLKLCKKVLSDNPLFVLINSYTTGLQPTVLHNLSKIVFGKKFNDIDAYEIGLNSSDGIVLPCGASCFSWNNV